MASTRPDTGGPRAAVAAGPLAPAVLARFLDTLFYERAAFLVDEVVRVDEAARALEAVMDTRRPLWLTALQRGDPLVHPRHVSGPELIQLTGNLGMLHAFLFHGVRWDGGWVGFGSRIHRADFKALARVGPPLALRSCETRTRAGPRRVVMRLAFEFRQEGRLCYQGDQSAMFMKGGRGLDANEDAAGEDPGADA
jgi:hypothetical protein